MIDIRIIERDVLPPGQCEDEPDDVYQVRYDEWVKYHMGHRRFRALLHHDGTRLAVESPEYDPHDIAAVKRSLEETLDTVKRAFLRKLTE